MPLLEIWHKLIIVVAQQVVLDITVGSNAFQSFRDWKGVNNFPPLGLSLSERRNVRRRYQHGEKMEHDDYFWQNDLVWASDSHAGIGITETAIPGNGRRKAMSRENKCPAERKFTVNLEYPE